MIKLIFKPCENWATGYSFTVVNWECKRGTFFSCIESFLKEKFKSVEISYYTDTNHDGLRRMYFNFADKEDEAFFHLYMYQETEI